MNLNDYQQMSSRTATKHDGELANYGLGIAGEAGEVADLIKKFVFHGHDINKEDIKKELGDVLWYVSQVARVAGLSLEEVATANIEKLYKRYPDGFSFEKSINRTENAAIPTEEPNMEMDIYNCEDCGRAFAVEKADDPECCPVCEAKIWEYSHTIKGEIVK